MTPSSSHLKLTYVTCGMENVVQVYGTAFLLFYPDTLSKNIVITADSVRYIGSDYNNARSSALYSRSDIFV